MTNGTIRRTRLAGLAACALLGCALLGSVRPAHAQTEVRISGQAFIDYYYQIASPDDAEEGLNGFTYRRFRITTDAKISDAFSARARLDAEAGTFGPKGPQPYVKDLFLQWKIGGGHSLRMGVTPPPAFQVAEEVWVYRGLEKTLLDLNRVVSSRDFGIRANGPLGTDKVRYGVMVGNNSTVFPEDDEYKRVYGQLEFYPTEHVIAAVASNWAAYDGPRENQLVFSAVAGYITDGWRIGAEGFYELATFERVDDAVSFGGSLFGDVWLTPEWGVVGRVDRVQREGLVEPEGGLPRIGTANTTFGLAAVVYSPHEDVRLMPNVLLAKDDDVDTADVQGRFTVRFDF